MTVSFSSSDDDELQRALHRNRSGRRRRRRRDERNISMADAEESSVRAALPTVTYRGDTVEIRRGTVFFPNRNRFVHLVAAQSNPGRFFGEAELHVWCRSTVSCDDVLLWDPVLSVATTLREAVPCSFYIFKGMTHRDGEGNKATYFSSGSVFLDRILAKTNCCPVPGVPFKAPSSLRATCCIPSLSNIAVFQFITDGISRVDAVMRQADGSITIGSCPQSDRPPPNFSLVPETPSAWKPCVLLGVRMRSGAKGVLFLSSNGQSQCVYPLQQEHWLPENVPRPCHRGDTAWIVAKNIVVEDSRKCLERPLRDITGSCLRRCERGRRDEVIVVTETAAFSVGFVEYCETGGESTFSFHPLSRPRLLWKVYHSAICCVESVPELQGVDHLMIGLRDGGLLLGPDAVDRGGQRCLRLLCHQNASIVRAKVVSPNLFVTMGSNAEVKLWDRRFLRPTPSSQVTVIHKPLDRRGEVGNCDLAFDKTLIAFHGGDEVLRVFDARRGTLVESFEIQGLWPHDCGLRTLESYGTLWVASTSVAFGTHVHRCDAWV